MYQKTTIVGNLGRDPELRYLSDGKAVCNLSIAVSPKPDTTLWFKATAWGKQAENASQYLQKGSQVLVEGELQADDHGNPRTYTRKDGIVVASFELTVHNVRYLARTNSSSNVTVEEDNMSVVEEEVDDIPF